ncbi:MAG TPA: glycosyl hydrolase family 28 protein [bacterium]|nr:glycosyl hydrolase family 28 protein [bacterium]
MMNSVQRAAAVLGILLAARGLVPLTACARDYDVLRYGAKGDGRTLNTRAIQKTIDHCSTTGGGTVTVPQGTFVTGMLEMRDDVTLNLEKGAVLQSSIDQKDFPATGPHAQCLLAMYRVNNASLTGEGTLDGRGDRFTVKNEAPGRPFVVLVQNSRNIRIRDVNLINAARWTLRLLASESVRVQGLRIHSLTNYNNDGIDIDGKDIIVSDCNIQCDDDAICLKSDGDSFCENVVVTNCVLRTNRNFIKFGTASRTGFRNIAISNITMGTALDDHLTNWDKRIIGVTDPITGIAGIALEIVDGGVMERVTITNITMDGVQTPLFIKVGKRTPPVGALKNILISNVAAKSCSQISSSITAVPGAFVENVTLRDFMVSVTGGGNLEQATRDVIENEKGYPENRMFGDSLPGYGLYIRHARNIVLDNVQFELLQPDMRSAIFLEDAHDVRIHHLKADPPQGEEPLIRQINTSAITVD